MDLLGADHIAALAATAAAAALAIRADGRVARGLAATLLAAYLLEHLVIALRGSWSLDDNLPLHLTDVVTVVAALALWTGRPLLFELTWFWALTASLQALLTPNLGRGYPDLLFLTFFVTHGGAVVAALHLAWGRGLTPRHGAVARAYAATAAVAAAAALGSLATGGNYMWLREKPDTASLLDIMGPWPWYIVSAAALGLALFLALDAPFRGRPERAGPSGRGRTPAGGPAPRRRGPPGRSTPRRSRPPG